MTEESIEPIPAATVILARDGSEGVEVLMLRRSSRGAFGGMWVFPGGRVENEDLAEADNGLVQLPPATQRMAQVGVDLCVLRIEFDDLAEAGNRRVQLPLSAESVLAGPREDVAYAD